MILLIVITVFILMETAHPTALRTWTLPTYRITKYEHSMKTIDNIVGEWQVGYRSPETAETETDEIITALGLIGDEKYAPFYPNEIPEPEEDEDGDEIDVNLAHACVYNAIAEWGNTTTYTATTQKGFTEALTTCEMSLPGKYYMTYNSRIDLMWVFYVWATHSFACNMIANSGVKTTDPNGEYWRTYSDGETPPTWNKWGPYIGILLQITQAVAAFVITIVQKTYLTMLASGLGIAAAFLNLYIMWRLYSDRIVLETTYIHSNYPNSVRTLKRSKDDESTVQIMAMRAGWITTCFAQPMVTIPCLTLLLSIPSGITDIVLLTHLFLLSIVLALISSIVSYYNLYATHRDSTKLEEYKTVPGSTAVTEHLLRIVPPETSSFISVVTGFSITYIIYMNPNSSSVYFWDSYMNVLIFSILIATYMSSDMLYYGSHRLQKFKVTDDGSEKVITKGGFDTALEYKFALDIISRLFILYVIVW